MAKTMTTRFRSVQDQLKNSDKADRLLMSLNRICLQKNQFYKPAEELSGKIYDLAENKSPKSILVIGEPTMLAVDERFKNAGVEITLALVSNRVPKDRFNLAELRLLNYCKSYNNIRVVRFEDLIGEENKMHFDLIIANPPYGQIGTNITQSILDSLDFGEFINLLPATNYRLSKTDLQKHVDPNELTVVYSAFEDAAVLPTVGHVYKEKVNELTPMGFRIETQTDPTTKKYFWANLGREKTYADMLETNRFAKDADQSFDKTIFLPMRTASGAHGDLASLSRGTKGLPYQIAMGLISRQSEVGKDNPQCGTYVRFSTIEEKKNCGEFLFGAGFKFVLWLLNSMRVDVAHKAEHEFWFPKVDWKRKWTPEEILREYGYSDSEIQEIVKNWERFPDFKRG